jgi:predicted PurR-regulated permease PerM
MDDDRETLLPFLKSGIAMLAFVCVAILIYLLSVAGNLLIPFILAIFIYILLGPLIGLLTKWRLPHVLVTILTMAVTIVAVVGVSQVVYQSVLSFTDGLPAYEGKFTGIWNRIAGLVGLQPDAFKSGWAFRDDPRIAEYLRGFSVPDVVQSLLESANTLLSNLVLVFLFLLFILLGRDNLLNKIKKAFSPEVSERVITMMRGIRSSTQKYIVIKTLVSFLVAGLVMLVTLAFGLDFVVVWGILTFILNFIPNLGPLVASVLPILFALVQFDNPMIAVWLGIIIIVMHFSVGNVLEPAMMGRSIQLSPLLILFSLIFWGSVWGIAGMFLSVPLTAIIKIGLDNIRPLRPLGVLMGEVAEEEPPGS